MNEKQNKELISLCGELAGTIGEVLIEGSGKMVKYEYSNLDFKTFEFARDMDDDKPQSFSNLFTNWEYVSDIEKIDNSTNYVIADLPFGLKRKGKPYELGWSCVIDIFDKMSEKSHLFANLSPLIFNSKAGERYRVELNKSGIYVRSVFWAPNNIYKPFTSFRPYLLHFTKQQSRKIFIAEINSQMDVVHAWTHYAIGGHVVDIENPLAGQLINERDFKGFNHYLMREHIKGLKTQYSEYNQKHLKDLCLEIYSVRSPKQFKAIKNSIFIPNVGSSDVKNQIEDLKLKQHNYFQIVLKEEIIINKYAANFFNSEIGKLSRDMLKTGSIIPKINKSVIGDAIIAIPPLFEQQKIVEANEQLKKLESAVNSLSKELSINPKNAPVILDKLDDVLNDLSLLTHADKIKALIRKGESKTREFKQSLSLDVRKQTNKKEKYIELMVIKTIFAFLNTEGGKLLIGVSDEGKITGIDEEIQKFHKKGIDDFLLHFKNLIKRDFGEGAYPLIDYRIVQIDGKNILLVDCSKSGTPYYLNDVSFYVRTNPATDKLEGAKMVEYIKIHFSEN